MIRINLIYDRLGAEVRRVKEDFITAGFLLAILFGLMATHWTINTLLISKLSSENRILTSKKEEYSKISQKTNDYQKSKEELSLVIDAIISLLEMQKGPTRVIENIGTRLPDEVWLTSIVEKSGGINIEGLSFSDPGVALFMDNLKSGGMFSSIELLGIDRVEIQGETIKKFTLKLSLDGKGKGNG
ncbi:MAG: PilN domain-containing protein [Nitrospinae bacterium]|nr:PilN domain-containing protein [Nitrospinota bacterium]